MKARSTSVAFQIFVNQIVVVPTANHSEYRITNANNTGATPSAYAYGGNPMRVPAYISNAIAKQMFGIPQGVRFLVDNWNCASTGLSRMKSSDPRCTCATIFERFGFSAQVVTPSISVNSATTRYASSCVQPWN